jgi:hypothetical protein
VRRGTEDQLWRRTNWETWRRGIRAGGACPWEERSGKDYNGDEKRIYGSAAGVDGMSVVLPKTAPKYGADEQATAGMV